MSPIYVRPEREQAEHDRLIRFLQAKYSKDFDAVANPGDERVAPVKVAAVTHFPDIVLSEDQRLAGVVEIETAASVNNLETMAKWVPFSRARVPFHLYVPVQGYEAALRLAEAHMVKAAEIWTYRPATEGFDLVRMFVDPTIAARATKAAAAKGASAKSAASKAAKPVAAKASVQTAAAVRPVASKPVASRPAASKAPAAKAPARVAAKAGRPVPKAKAPVKPKPSASKAKPAARRAAAVPKRPTKPARPSSAKPASKGAKKGAGARKGR